MRLLKMLNYYLELCLKKNIPLFARPYDSSYTIDVMMKSWKLRQLCTARYAWAIPDRPAIEILRNLMPIFEVAAGSGYWARLIADSKNHPDYYAYDNGEMPWKKLWYDVQKQMPPDEVIKKSTMFFCWPSYDQPYAYEWLSQWQPKKVAYIGEGSGGCTGCDRFHRHLENNYTEVTDYSIPRFDGVRDYLTVYELKS
jgi:hypothetical protein